MPPQQQVHLRTHGEHAHLQRLESYCICVTRADFLQQKHLSTAKEGAGISLLFPQRCQLPLPDTIPLGVGTIVPELHNFGQHNVFDGQLQALHRA